MSNINSSGWHGTTILAVKKNKEVVIASDGQVSLGQTVIKGTAKKVRRLSPGGADVLVNVDQTFPSGLTTSISNNTLSVSGTPDLSNTSYSFSVYTTGGNQNCNQVSQTITINRDLDSPIINLISGSLVQTTTQGSAIQPIELTYGGAATDLSISGLPTNLFSIVKNINAYTIQGSLRDSYTIRASLPFPGFTYTGSITTISDGGCQEETRTIKITVQSAPGTTTGGTTTGGTTTGGTTTGGTTYNTTTSNTGIYFENGTCKCPNATVGDTETINGVTYTAVNNSTIAGEIANGNYNLCTTPVTNMAELFASNSSFNSDINFWDTSNVTNMNGLFGNATAFNQPIGNWDVSKVTIMRGMFGSAQIFNQPIGNWNTSSVTDMQHYHFNTCPAIPAHVRAAYTSCRSNMNKERKNRDPSLLAPKEYWTKVGEDVGMIDQVSDDGSNGGIKLIDGHKLVARSELPEHKNTLFMPDGTPKEKAEEDSFDKLVAEL